MPQADREKEAAEKALVLFKYLDLGLDEDVNDDNDDILEKTHGKSQDENISPLIICKNDAPDDEENCFTASPRLPNKRTVLQFSSFKGAEDTLLSPRGRFKRKGNEDWKLIAPGSLKKLTSANSVTNATKTGSETTKQEDDATLATEPMTESLGGFQKAVQLLTLPARKMSKRIGRSQSNNGGLNTVSSIPSMSLERFPMSPVSSNRSESVCIETHSFGQSKHSDARDPDHISRSPKPSPQPKSEQFSSTAPQVKGAEITERAGRRRPFGSKSFLGKARKTRSQTDEDILILPQRKTSLRKILGR